MRFVLTVVCSLALACGSFAEAVVQGSGTRAAGASASPVLWAAVDAIIRAGDRGHNIPGAVLVVGHDGKVIYRKAYGERSLEPRREAMTVDTIFDMASLTKVIATTTAVMQLMEQGKMRMNDPVAKYIPEFAQNGKEDITIRQLLTHYSGLAPDIDLTPAFDSKESAFRLACAETPQVAPGSEFIYSDTNSSRWVGWWKSCRGRRWMCIRRSTFFSR